MRAFKIILFHPVARDPFTISRRGVLDIAQHLTNDKILVEAACPAQNCKGWHQIAGMKCDSLFVGIPSDKHAIFVQTNECRPSLPQLVNDIQKAWTTMTTWPRTL